MFGTREEVVIIMNSVEDFNNLKTELGDFAAFAEIRMRGWRSKNIYTAILPGDYTRRYVCTGYVMHTTGKIKAGQMLRGHSIRENDEEYYLSGFACNCADADLPAIEDVHRFWQTFAT